MAKLMPLPLTVSCSSKIQIGFTFLVPVHPGSPGKRAVKRVCVCVCVCRCTDCRMAFRRVESLRAHAYCHSAATRVSGASSAPPSDGFRLKCDGGDVVDVSARFEL